MKKISILLILLFGVMAFSLTGCSNGGTFTEKSYASGANEIEKVMVQASDRELEIGTSEDDQIYVSENKELVIKLVFNKDWTDYIGTKPSAKYRKIKIRIPDGLISAFSAKTTNENIEVGPLSFTEGVSLNANGGSIVCDRVNVGKTISLTAKNGDIRGTIVGDWDDFSISCTYKKGDCNLPASKEGGDKSLTADCNNGDIDIQFVQ